MSAIPCPNGCGRSTTAPILRDLGECLRCRSNRLATLVDDHDYLLLADEYVDAYAAALARGGLR